MRNKYLLFILPFISGSIHLQAQHIAKPLPAGISEGYYTGFYIDKKAIDNKNNKIYLRQISTSEFSVEQSQFGQLTFRLPETASDTLKCIPDSAGVIVKYVLSSQRIHIMKKINGKPLSFVGKFSHKDDKDLAEKTADNKRKLEEVKKNSEQKWTFTGKLLLKNGDSKKDTIEVRKFSIEARQGDYMIRDYLVSVSSRSGAFKEFTTKTKYFTDSHSLKDFENTTVDFKMEPKKQVVRFSDTNQGIKFSGVMLHANNR